ncbi:MAG: PqqD family protein [Ignavibacteriae bacterium]|nr:PqqD family protein [Ignavibacteriota bacterium]
MKKQDINLLTLIPTRTFGWSEDEEGVVTVDMPRFHVAWMQRLLVPRAKYPYIRVKLDRFGSHVWKQIDGVRTVLEVAELLRAEFGDAVEDHEARVAAFMRLLQRRAFVTLKTAEGEVV